MKMIKRPYKGNQTSDIGHMEESLFFLSEKGIASTDRLQKVQL